MPSEMRTLEGRRLLPICQLREGEQASRPLSFMTGGRPREVCARGVHCPPRLYHVQLTARDLGK